MMKAPWIALLLAAALAMSAQAADKGAAPAKAPLAKDQPIDISSDKLDVLQNEHKAIFSGNVIATQGTTNMRSEKMTVYYTDSSSPKKSEGEAGQGISRIDAEGNVVFTTPAETAKGDFAVYNVQDNSIDLTGKTVVLTRDKNILKGTRMVYNMTTGRSVLTSGNGAAVAGSTEKKPARVHGLFVPKSSETPAAKAPEKKTETAPETPKAN